MEVLVDVILLEVEFTLLHDIDRLELSSPLNWAELITGVFSQWRNGGI